jgi:hypothetical protein
MSAKCSMTQGPWGDIIGTISEIWIGL